ncbi:MAG: hypothetical protein KC416_17430 [Myxococcales bacterium]|nr:hypothetical protein [Myxococcales bacterium]
MARRSIVLPIAGVLFFGSVALSQEGVPTAELPEPSSVVLRPLLAELRRMPAAKGAADALWQAERALRLADERLAAGDSKGADRAIGLGRAWLVFARAKVDLLRSRQRVLAAKKNRNAAVGEAKRAHRALQRHVSDPRATPLEGPPPETSGSPPSEGAP